MRIAAAIWVMLILLADAMMVFGVGAAAGAGSGISGRDMPRATILIHDIYELQNMSLELNGSYQLANDIDASATRSWNSRAGFAPIGNSSNRFNGTLDGKGYNITGLCINRPGTDYVGLFGYIGKNSSVKNIGVVNINVTGHYWVGGLVGYSYSGAVNNSYATGKVNGTSSVGGLTGYLDWYARVILSGASVKVTGAHRVGGLVGGTNWGSSILSSNATGNVDGMDNVGGLVGRAYRCTLNNTYATGNVTGINYIGGLVGSNFNGNVMMSYATAKVKGSNFTGGLVGDNCGYVENSYAEGDVTGTSQYVGGLAGFCHEPTEGRLVGYASYYPIAKSYSTGYVTGTKKDIGGFAGYAANDTVSDCFWDIEASGSNSSSGGTGKTTAEMKTRSTFTDSGWDFDGIWHIMEDITYPLFRWQETESPKADAGIDQTVGMGTEAAFDGTKSSDNFGILNYIWSFIDKGPVALYGVRPTYQFDDLGIFVVTLKVTDFAGNWGTDSLTVTVIDISAPVVNAGSDQTIDEGTLVTFNGSGCSDNVGIVSYAWTFTDGAPMTLHGVQPTYQFDYPGIFAVTLKVTDAAGNWNTSTVNITVNDITAPVADAGPDRKIDEGTLLAFNGTGSSDEIGVVDYSWTFLDRARITLYGPQPEYQFDNPGIFVVTLSVTDAAGFRGTDTMTVTVIDVTRPFTSAGPDRTVDEGTLVTLDGSGSIDNVMVVNYTWTLMDGTPVTVYGARPTYRFDNPGIFVVTLNVTDVRGNWGIDTMTVTVKDITAPIAEAGPDMTVDEGTTVTFNGSGSSDNLGIVNYTWTFDYGTQRIILYGVSPSFTLSVPGVYHIVVNVSDAAGFRREDTMTLTVRDLTPPVANAGPDQKVPAGSSIAFNGSLSTDNVAISKFFWNFTYNGKAQSLEGKKVSFKFDKVGVYKVVLTVIDTAGNRDEDKVVVTVEPSVNVDDGGLMGLLWMPVLLMVMAVGAGYYMFMKRKVARPKGPGKSGNPSGPSQEMEEE